MSRAALAGVILGLLTGCGSSAPVGDPTKKITWAEFEKMPSEDQADPYVLLNLDDDARQKFNEKMKKSKKP
jgi:hypothetical protein